MSKKKIAVLLILATVMGVLIYGIIRPAREAALEHQRQNPGKHEHR